MKLFLTKIGFLTLLLFSICISIFLFADGFTDPFYLRFTSPKQKSLILGTSRSAQGINPYILDSVFKVKSIVPDFYNYSFSIVHSPYGETYTNSIFKKIELDKNENRYFVLTVDPWSIACNSETESENNYREANKFIDNQYFVNMNPNVEYFISEYKNSYFDILFPQRNDRFYSFLHDNGWLEVTTPIDSLTINNRTKEKVKNYKETKLPYYKISNYRVYHLDNLIEKLKLLGKVFLVRLPVSKEMSIVENELMPDFDSLMVNIAAQNKVPYINLLDSYVDSCIYHDGNHISKKSVKFISSKLASKILENEMSKN